MVQPISAPAFEREAEMGNTREMKSLKNAGTIMSLLAVLMPSAAFAAPEHFELTDPDFRFYRLKVARRVRQNWHAPIYASDNYPIVWFALAPSGQVTTVRLHTSSKDKVQDQKAIAAISASAPFSAFPAPFNKAPGLGFFSNSLETSQATVLTAPSAPSLPTARKLTKRK